MNLKRLTFAATAFVVPAINSLLFAQPSSPVSGLAAFHRSGQTFLTWNEISGTDVTYRVYRSSASITNVSNATFIGAVDQNSSVNIRNGSGAYFKIYDNGSALSASTGLMVYTVASSGNNYYAVTTNNAGGENKTVSLGSSTLNVAIAETVGLPEPVLQGTDHYVHWVNWQNTPLLPKMTSNPKVSAYNFMCRNVKTSLTQILNVGLYGGMNDYTDKIDQIHGDEFKLSVDNPPPDLWGIQPVGANDFDNPPNTCWYGFGDNFMPQQTLTGGVVANYTQLRIIYVTKWVLRKWTNVDPNRVYLTGSSFGGFGAIQLGFAFPNIFAAVWAQIPRFDMGGPEWDSENGGVISTRYKNIWGTVQSNLPTTNIKSSYPDYAASNEGYKIYDRLDHLYVAQQNPQTNFPVFIIGSGKMDTQTGWNEKGRFAQTLNASHHQFFHYWENLGHKFSTTVFDSVYKRAQLLRYRLNQSYVAINNLSVDDNQGLGNDLLPGGSVTGDSRGTINGYADWLPAGIVDLATEYRAKVYLRGSVMDQSTDTQGVTTATATLTPRRLQKFPHASGQSYTYENRRLTDNALVASGSVSAGANGLIHVNNFQITRAGNILILKPASGTANQAPKAVASANPASGVAPLAVNFTGANSTDADGSIASYAWNFGNGATSTATNPSYTYNTAGSYTATLTVTDNGGLTNSASVNITVTNSTANQPPKAVVAASPTSGVPPLTVNFTGSGSSDPDGSIALYSWNFGDGASSTLTNPSHAYNAVGNYTATLAVTDNAGLTNSTSITITATSTSNQPPAAVASANPTSGNAPLTVNFTGSNSFDTNGSIVSYLWNFGDGSSATMSNPAHVYTAAGNYTATLTVTDNGGATGAAFVAIAVNTPGANQKPKATITAPANGFSVASKTTISYAGQGTDPEDGTLTGASFTWKEIRPNGTTVLMKTGSATGSYKLTTVGQHFIRCIVKDSQGLADSTYITVTVTDPLANQPPNPVLTASPTSGGAPLNVTFTGSSSTDPNGSIVSYNWNFGDGTSAASADAQHLYNTSGTYTVIFTATDNGGAGNSALTTITVNPTGGGGNQSPNAVASASPTSGVAPFLVNFTGSNSNDPDGSIVSYAWNFGNGTTATTANPPYTYNTAGNYTATLTVTDNGGLTKLASVAMTVTAPVSNQPPNAVVSASPMNGTAPLVVNFTGSNSSDPDGSIVSYAWNFGNDASATTANPQQAYNAAGSYTATLTVTDNGGLTKSVSVVITVTAPSGGNQPPVATIFSPVDNSTMVPNTTLTYSGEATDPEDGVLLAAKFTWRLIQPDGTIKLISTGKKSGSEKVSKLGLNRMQCIVSDSQGLTDTAEVKFTIAITKAGADEAILAETPSTYVLEQNRPNPFNPMTALTFYLKENGHATLTIYNAVGQKVTTVVNQNLPAGYHTRRVNAQKWPTGVYFYELQVNDFRALKRMILAK